VSKPLLICPDQVLTVKQAAARLNRHTSTLSLWRQRNYGPAWFKLGTDHFYREEDIDAWLARQERAS